MNGLKYIRTNESNMTMEKLADKLGVSKQLVSMWENGKKKIPEKRTLQLEKILGIPRKYFLLENVSEREQLEIRHFRIKRDVESTTIEYEEKMVDSQGNEEVIPFTHVDVGALEALEFSAMDLKVDDLGKRIASIICSYEGNVASAQEVLCQYEEKLKAFERFADIMAGTEQYGTMSQILRAMELFFGVNEEKYQIWGECNPLDNTITKDESGLIQNLVEVLQADKKAKVEKLKRDIEETEKLLKMLEE